MVLTRYWGWFLFYGIALSYLKGLGVCASPSPRPRRERFQSFCWLLHHFAHSVEQSKYFLDTSFSWKVGHYKWKEKVNTWPGVMLMLMKMWWLWQWGWWWILCLQNWYILPYFTRKGFWPTSLQPRSTIWKQSRWLQQILHLETCTLWDFQKNRLQRQFIEQGGLP